MDFDDEQFGGYSVSQLEQLLKECQFFDLVETARAVASRAELASGAGPAGRGSRLTEEIFRVTYKQPHRGKV